MPIPGTTSRSPNPTFTWLGRCPPCQLRFSCDIRPLRACSSRAGRTWGPWMQTARPLSTTPRQETIHLDSSFWSSLGATCTCWMPLATRRCNLPAPGDVWRRSRAACPSFRSPTSRIACTSPSLPTATQGWSGCFLMRRRTSTAKCATAFAPRLGWCSFSSASCTASAPRSSAPSPTTCPASRHWPRASFPAPLKVLPIFLPGGHGLISRPAEARRPWTWP
mmetsp:Transcript_66862/g.157544  ORF Transcript_66862/g.157544 Transcript_66862/m.157544 type:complete len:221 (+) Transcript_66862:1146-1808(+)